MGCNTVLRCPPSLVADARAMIELLPFFLLVTYLVPFLVAALRGHDAAPLVLVANLLLGWTGVGWLAVLAWAACTPARGAGAAQPPPPERAIPNR